jgi:hypothetical protein
MTSTLSVIQPILYATYGKGGMVKALAEHLAEKIDNYAPTLTDLEDEDRERMVMLVCWNWFSGGTTAASVAKKIEAALTATETEGR